uniref:Smr domain-containing protein n=1 Tax=Chromera velia CCMP2878 TaxID=1169474 RepID=A0A0G4F2G5_9ALVE|mmetsp:Transcript_3092/g.6315  ORF Transcript_3092/g.6315 Transcript_3092/m.6315 type:complete len:341 (+) Transcript_3092:278-1300(+)|eukprot:Cvel_14736.t1-p1 / transcript=Cvel_14736.t1 / gene=Cvel_14736 / organism=Chromera_velia_CCMP2878 / gene_product=hypothetical protein / transcript_product=hypothetical protein / location=Cvel_scaffold1060:25164-26183(+) / protein_length=340 / sequence_SO=supercontig / SO=protein_coding / is_pseudo=false
MRSIQKHRNFPSRIIRENHSGSNSEVEKDLHGYSCGLARETMKEAFSVPVEVVVHSEESKAKMEEMFFTFVIGRGRHSNSKFSCDLQKATADGLRDAGLEENRHADKHCRGSFKLIDSKDAALKAVKVYPHMNVTLSSGTNSSSTASGDSASKDATEDEIAAIQSMSEKADKLSLLGLVHGMQDLHRIRQEISEDQKQMYKFDLNNAAKTFIQRMGAIFQSGEPIGPEDLAVCEDYLEYESSREDPKPFFEQWNEALPKLPRRQDGPLLAKLRRGLKKEADELSKLEALSAKSARGGYTFPSAAALVQHEKALEAAKVRTADAKQKLADALMWKEETEGT